MLEPQRQRLSQIHSTGARLDELIAKLKPLSTVLDAAGSR